MNRLAEQERFHAASGGFDFWQFWHDDQAL
jgi:galactokinase/mevalonate kinase-like predicted kinase